MKQIKEYNVQIYTQPNIQNNIEWFLCDISKFDNNDKLIKQNFVYLSRWIPESSLSLEQLKELLNKSEYSKVTILERTGYYFN